MRGLELVSVVVHCGFGGRAARTRCQNERGEGPREVIVSGHGTLGFLASGLYVELETRLTRWAGKVRNCAI